jgi:LysR substrate binding domain
VRCRSFRLRDVAAPPCRAPRSLSAASTVSTTGETFLDEARGVLQHAEAAVNRVKALALGKQGKVRVGHAAAVEVLRRALRSFSKTHPHVSADLREMTSHAMLRGLRDHTLDVALTVAISPRDFDGWERIRSVWPRTGNTALRGRARCISVTWPVSQSLGAVARNIPRRALACSRSSSPTRVRRRPISILVDGSWGDEEKLNDRGCEV